MQAVGQLGGSALRLPLAGGRGGGGLAAGERSGPLSPLPPYLRMVSSGSLEAGHLPFIFKM